MKPHHGIVPPLLAAFASIASAQCPLIDNAATYPNPPSTYPMTSNRYSVQYQLGTSGTWTNAQVYISYYGATNSSPFLNYSRYSLDTSMSFVSIPAGASTAVALRVTKLWGSNFPAQVTVRPSVKGIQVNSVSGGTVQLSTNTSASFAGDQFILWWNVGSQENSAIQGLALFLNPPYTPPAGSNVKTIAAPTDLTGDLSHFDTLAFQGAVAVGGTGDQAFVVPANIVNLFFAPGSWLQGKLRFAQGGAGIVRRVYGPGVLDASRFTYMYRHCDSTSDHPADGYESISFIAPQAGAAGSPSLPDRFIFDGIISTDADYYNTGYLNTATVNNVKIIGWNANNDGFQLGSDTHVSNVFVRTADDSLKMWGSYITVTNATVWQNWNGGVVNLGWYNNSPGDDCLIDGVYAVKTDWFAPATLSWTIDTLNWQNNAIVASLMVPGSNFGALLPSLYRNIYVEDPPRVFLSLKIAPDQYRKSTPADLALPGLLNLNLENVFTPASILQNSIGFQTANGAPLTGAMNIGLTNVMVTPPNGTATALTSANAAAVGQLITNGDNINIQYGSAPNGPAPAALSTIPSSGSAASQVFTFVFSDPAGWQNLSILNVLVNSFLDGRQACYVAFQPSGASSGSLLLVDDAGDAGGPYQSLALPGNGTVSNSQCSIAGAGSSVSALGNSLWLTLAITFSQGFSGNRVIYSAAGDSAGNNTGWQALGVRQVPGAAPATTTAVVAMTPTRGAGITCTSDGTCTNAIPFTFTFSDTKGTHDLGVVNILINNFLDGRHACYLAYSNPLGVLYLVNDPGTALLPGQPLSTGGTLGNSQCTVTWGSAPVAVDGNNLTISLTVLFSAAAFSGNRVVYLAARDGSEANNTGWQASGTWLVGAN
ncbi:MAG TPA: hypothetical protein VE959_36680 [Bryobacteraceae bacterium]|nr:hypothetical protein [Bryobacteraceae bacterium]